MHTAIDSEGRTRITLDMLMDPDTDLYCSICEEPVKLVEGELQQKISGIHTQGEKRLHESNITFVHKHPRRANHEERKFPKSQIALANHTFSIVYGLLKSTDYNVLANQPLEEGVGNFNTSDISVVTKDNKRIEIFIQPGTISPFSDLEQTMTNLTKEGIYTGIILSADNKVARTPYFRQGRGKRKNKYRKIAGNEKKIAELQYWLPAYIDHVNGKLFQAELSPAYAGLVPLWDLDKAIEMHVGRDESLTEMQYGKELVEERIKVSYRASAQRVKRQGKIEWKPSQEVTEEVNILLGSGKIQIELEDHKDADKIYVTHPYFIFREVNNYKIAILEPWLHREQRLEMERFVQMPMNLT